MTESAHTPSTLSYRLAVADDAAAIARLVNSAYRGDSSRQGWTTEADLLEGDRINADQVRELILADESLILLCQQNQQPELSGCVHLQKTENAAYLGMFVVKPTQQGSGIGKQFMREAETLAQHSWQVQTIWMTVITLRHELIAYYGRRGYQRTGQFKPFPSEISKEVMLVPDLHFEVLEKRL
ncbi:N-acetyltransferase [Undibacterium sp.]|uniref:GNAT family N-acetyltransferase n=1 Tax=Undibacterium sp. TaxID=1914977 RepID=UPI0025D84913|nr:GNAT family N-acetyltransferase [Undibacterium sp.]MCX7219870.1 GNAT family N-acetyltransferase [Burkholderiales bacterium]